MTEPINHEFLGPGDRCVRWVLDHRGEGTIWVSTKDGTRVEVTDDRSTYKHCNRPESEHMETPW